MNILLLYQPTAVYVFHITCHNCFNDSWFVAATFWTNVCLSVSKKF